MAPDGTAPLRADAERNRRKLLDAAREIYAERGLDVTLDEVARHAGVGTGTAYRRFRNKGELIEALMVERMEELVDLARSMLDEPDPWQALTGYVEGALALQARDRGLKDILFAVAPDMERLTQTRSQLAPIVSELVRRAVDAGVVRPDLDTSDLPLINIMLNTLVDFGRDVEPELYRRYMAIVLDGIRADPAPRAERLPVPPVAVPRFLELLAAWKAGRRR